MESQNFLVARPSATRSMAHNDSAKQEAGSDVLELFKVIFIAAAPPVIMFLGAIAATNAAHELSSVIENVMVKIEHEPIDEALRKELIEKFRLFIWIWPLIPSLQLVVAAFAFVAGSVRSERAEGVAAFAYLAGLFASLAAYTLYEPYFALFTGFWRWLTEFTYFGSAVVVYLNAYNSIICNQQNSATCRKAL